VPIIRHLTYSGRKTITMDLRRVERIDRESIRYLMNLYMVLKESGGRLELIGNHRYLAWMKDRGADDKIAEAEASR